MFLLLCLGFPHHTHSCLSDGFDAFSSETLLSASSVELQAVDDGEAKGTWLFSREQINSPHKCLQPVAHQIWELEENFRIIWPNCSLSGVLEINLVKDEI